MKNQEITPREYFEKIELTDGGPNDQGRCIGFIIAESLEEATAILNVDHGFIVLRKISREQYIAYREEALHLMSFFGLDRDQLVKQLPRV